MMRYICPIRSHVGVVVAACALLLAAGGVAAAGSGQVSPQYFERGRFEYHPQQVTARGNLAVLGYPISEPW